MHLNIILLSMPRILSQVVSFPLNQTRIMYTFYISPMSTNVLPISSLHVINTERYPLVKWMYTYSTFDCISVHGRIQRGDQIIHCRTDFLNSRHQVVQLWNLFFCFKFSFHSQSCAYSLQGRACSFYQAHARKQQLPIFVTPCLIVVTLVCCNLLELR